MASSERSPTRKFGIAILVAALLTIPLFAVFLMAYDRQSQSETARDSISQGWAAHN